MGQLIHDPIATLVEINWWGTRRSCRVHNRFACTEIRHYGDVIFYHCRTTNYGNNYRSFWSYRYADPRSKYHKIHWINHCRLWISVLFLWR